MSPSMLALYVGPDQVMTVTSGLASVVGLLLIFWNKVVNTFFRLLKIFRHTPEAAPTVLPPAEPPAKNL